MGAHPRVNSPRQAPLPEHPLAKHGYRRPPFWLWRRSRWAYVQVGKALDIWAILTGRCSLHRAWQEGHDHGHAAEVYRTVVMKGR